jgi:hypothetical protein
MHIGKARHPMICEVLGKMKNEYSRGLRRLYKGGNFVSKFQDILHRSKHIKRRRNKHFQHRMHSQAPRCTEEGARHTWTSTKVPGAWKGGTRRLEAQTHAPGANALRPKALFCYFLCPKTPVFSLKSCGSFPYKYLLPHS